MPFCGGERRETPPVPPPKYAYAHTHAFAKTPTNHAFTHTHTYTHATQIHHHEHAPADLFGSALTPQKLVESVVISATRFSQLNLFDAANVSDGVLVRHIASANL